MSRPGSAPRRLNDAGRKVLERTAPGRRLVYDHLSADEVVQLGALTRKVLAAGAHWTGG